VKQEDAARSTPGRRFKWTKPEDSMRAGGDDDIRVEFQRHDRTCFRGSAVSRQRRQQELSRSLVLSRRIASSHRQFRMAPRRAWNPSRSSVPSYLRFNYTQEQKDVCERRLTVTAS